MKPNQNLREALGLTQAEYAGFMRVSESMVSLVEINRRRYPGDSFFKANRLLDEWLRIYPTVEVPAGPTLLDKLDEAIQSEQIWGYPFNGLKTKIEKELKSMRTELSGMENTIENLQEDFDIQYHALAFVTMYSNPNATRLEQTMLALALEKAKIKATDLWLLLLVAEAEMAGLQAEIERKETLLNRLKFISTET